MTDKVFRVNPTEREMDLDLDKSDAVVMFHNAKSRAHFETLLDGFINRNKNEIVYIHYYTKDNKYTVGVKERD